MPSAKNWFTKARSLMGRSTPQQQPALFFLLAPQLKRASTIIAVAALCRNMIVTKGTTPGANPSLLMVRGDPPRSCDTVCQEHGGKCSTLYPPVSLYKPGMGSSIAVGQRNCDTATRDPLVDALCCCEIVSTFLPLWQEDSFY